MAFPNGDPHAVSIRLKHGLAVAPFCVGHSIAVDHHQRTPRIAVVGRGRRNNVAVVANRVVQRIVGPPKTDPMSFLVRIDDRFQIGLRAICGVAVQGFRHRPRCAVVIGTGHKNIQSFNRVAERVRRLPNDHAMALAVHRHGGWGRVLAVIAGERRVQNKRRIECNALRV